MLYVTGINSNIIVALRRSMRFPDYIKRLDLDMNSISDVQLFNVPANGRNFIFCHGYLSGEHIAFQEEKDIIKTLTINLISTVIICEKIFNANSNARIIIIGSESANYGSYDMTYACAKAGLECYVKTKKLKPNQQLLCISPHIIIDAGMTTRRDDLDNVDVRALDHPKKRWITSMEVAKTIYHYLYVDEGYTTGQVIRMNGGLR